MKFKINPLVASPDGKFEEFLDLQVKLYCSAFGLPNEVLLVSNNGSAARLINIGGVNKRSVEEKHCRLLEKMKQRQENSEW